MRGGRSCRGGIHTSATVPCQVLCPRKSAGANVTLVASSASSAVHRPKETQGGESAPSSPVGYLEMYQPSPKLKRVEVEKLGKRNSVGLMFKARLMMTDAHGPLDVLNDASTDPAMVP